VEPRLYPGPTNSGIFLEGGVLPARSLMEGGIKI
jgi:hypothetical protein